MSPRYVSTRSQEPGLATVYPPPRPSLLDPPDVKAEEKKAERDYLDSLEKTRNGLYAPGTPFSYFRDLLAIERHRRAREGTFEQPRFALGEASPAEPPAFNEPTEQQALRRLQETHRRDLTSNTGSTPDLLRPSMPGRLAEIFGKAARRTSGLVDALPRMPLERGMVDNTGTQMVVRVPALATGTAVAVAVENAIVQETDPTSSGIAAPLGSIAGQVDASRQLVDFSRPSIDDVLSDDLGARLAESLDAQLFNGIGSAGSLRGFLQWSSIISVTGSVTNQAAYVQSLWQAFSQIAGGSSGYGDADRDNFLTVIHPRRFAWLQSGFGTPIAAALPGTVVLVPNAPANLGAGTNEDHSLVIDKTAVLLVGGSPTIRVFEEAGSSTQTIRFSAHADAALVVLNAKAVARVTAGTAPSGF